MSPYALVVVSLAVLSVYLSLAQGAGLGYAQEVIDKNNFNNENRFSNRAFNSQRRNSKSMSFMEYLFPMSRNAKVSNNFPQDRSEHGLVGTTTTRSDDKEETTVRIQSTSPISDENYTIDEGRATGTTRKGTTSGKRKGSSRLPSTTPKIKATPKVTQQSTWSSSSVSNKATTVKPATKQSIDKSTTTGTTSQQKTTHKHYTVYPSVITTRINPPTSSLKNKQTESTTAAVVTSNELSNQSEPTSELKVTLSDIAKVSESVTKQSVESENSVDDKKDLDGREGELDLRDKPQKHNVQIVDDTKKEGVPLPDGSTSVLAKPTKYHYYPHNQHIYLLPECAIQQVCNAVYVRLNYTQPLCACPARHRDPCSASLNADDQHTTQLSTDSKKKFASKAITLVKTCEAVTEMRECRAPRDWSLLALQNIRTGKSHYLVICRCPEEFTLEGPMSHDQPTYASVPGIRVYGMMCVQSLRHSTQGYVSVTARPSTPSYQVSYSQPHYNTDGYTRYPGYIGPGVYYNRMARSSRHIRSVSSDLPPIPWDRVKELVDNADWEN